jgi:DNA ligase (NAD+)
MPDVCPVCGTPVGRAEGEAATRCPNRVCPAQVKGAIFYFARRFAMDVDHLGVALVEQLVDKGIVKDVADLYTLKVEDIAALERMGDKSAKNVVDSIQGSKTRTLDRLLCGLGIPQIGQVAAKQLAEEARTLEQLVAWSEAEVRDRVDAIRGFGPKMVDSVVLYLADPVHHELLEKLKALGVGAPQPVAEVAKDGPLKGKSVCVTGVLSKKREDVHADIRAAGGEVHDSVKKTTSILVAGDKTGKSKLDQAKKFKTEVVDEKGLYAIISGERPANA